MKINIRTEKKKNNWIFSRMAEELRKGIPYVSINSKKKTDVYYYLNYIYFKPHDVGVKIAWFTHLEKKGMLRKFFRYVASQVDYHICHSEKTANVLHRMGYKNAFSIKPGTDLKKQITFGVVGRTYNSERKGEYLVAELVARGYNVVALGVGWPCPVFSENTNLTTRKEFYKNIDYLLVTAVNEGGPMPVIEALAMGVPVIAPDVGWCWEFPVLKYKKNNFTDMEKLLRKLVYPPSWEDYVREHKDFFERVLRPALKKPV